MSEPIVVVDTSGIRVARLEEVKAGFKDLVAFVEADEPRVVAYGVYLSEDESHVTVLQVHPDSASMENHMEVAGPIFARFADLLTLETMDVYGAPSERLVTMLERKAQMLGGARVAVHDLHAGLARFAG